MEKTAEQICHHCGVPNDLHGTCCGWENAAAPCNANMVITDTRHPGFGQPLNLWKNTDVDILSDDGFDISAKVGYRSGWNDATAHLQSTIDQLKQENERLRKSLDEIDLYVVSAIHYESPIHKTIKSMIISAFKGE